MQKGATIVIEATIGAGKTSFAQALAGLLGPETVLLLEPDEKENANPYLALYYQDPARYAFTMQMHLLGIRYQAHQQAQWTVQHRHCYTVQDRSIMGDVSFANLQHLHGFMTKMEFQTYRNMYEAMTASILLPSICVYLDVSTETSLRRIARRMQQETGRQCETAISSDYLVSLKAEIEHMVGVLDRQGVHVLHVPWDMDLEEAAYKKRVAEIAATIKDIEPLHFFREMHRRIVTG